MRAFNLAQDAHEGQYRASGRPYITHPCVVCDILIDLGFDVATLCAALLHDTVEDTYVTDAQLREEFGEEIANLVQGVTKLDKLQFASKEEEQAENIRKMFFAMAKDIRVIIIKLADRLHNMRSLHYLSERRQQAMAKETIDIFAPLAGRLGISQIKCELEDLCLKYLDDDAYEYLSTNIAMKKEERQSLVDTVIFELSNILKELEVYEDVKHIPTTNTGKVRRELQDLIRTNFKYKRVVKKAINTNPIIYNRLCEAFLGGYTHANWIYADEVLKNVDSYDIASSYPYVLVTQKYPNSEFRSCNIKTREQMSNRLCYLLVVRFKNIKCKYFNTFISSSKCRNLRGAKYDNGRLISAAEFEITLTDIDFYFYLDTYECEYEILESYYSSMSYLPKTLIEFILDKYVGKTELKGVEGKEMEYGRIKGMYNSIYGMSVTNNIRDNVIYNDDFKTWEEVPLTNEEIIEKLNGEKKKAFLSFAYGVWVTAYARNNLLRRVIANDDFVVYCDTDSCKLIEGYNKKVFEDYNESVKNRIEFVCKILKLDIKKYAPSDIKGNSHMMGLFEKECNYEEFITQGAKKYAYKIDDKIHITVAGIPKKGSSALKSLEDFRDDFVFSYSDTEKNLVMYTEEQSPLIVQDYLGLEYEITDRSGCCILPNTYKLSKSLDYANLISDDSSKRARFKEVL